MAKTPRTRYRVVARPATRGAGREASPDTRAFLETVETGHAVRVPLRGVSYRRLVARYGQAAHRKGLRCRVRRDGDAVIAWCETKEDK